MLTREGVDRKTIKILAMKTDIWPPPPLFWFIFFSVDQQKNKEHSYVRSNQVRPLIMASQDLPVRFWFASLERYFIHKLPCQVNGKSQPTNAGQQKKKAWDWFSFIHLLKAIKLGEYYMSLLNNIEITRKKLLITKWRKKKR